MFEKILVRVELETGLGRREVTNHLSLLQLRFAETREAYVILLSAANRLGFDFENCPLLTDTWPPDEEQMLIWKRNDGMAGPMPEHPPVVVTPLTFYAVRD